MKLFRAFIHFLIALTLVGMALCSWHLLSVLWANKWAIGIERMVIDTKFYGCVVGLIYGGVQIFGAAAALGLATHFDKKLDQIGKKTG